jgi:hypothetical protein
MEYPHPERNGVTGSYRFSSPSDCQTALFLVHWAKKVYFSENLE